MIRARAYSLQYHHDCGLALHAAAPLAAEIAIAASRMVLSARNKISGSEGAPSIQDEPDSSLKTVTVAAIAEVLNYGTELRETNNPNEA